MKKKAFLKDIALLKGPNIKDKITKLEIEGYQDPAVMEVLFSLLANSIVRSLDIESSSLSQWMVQHIKNICPFLRELGLFGK